MKHILKAGRATIERLGLAAGCPVQSVTFCCFSAADLAVYQAVLA
jgi:hypothetical protein